MSWGAGHAAMIGTVTARAAEPGTRPGPADPDHDLASTIRAALSGSRAGTTYVDLGARLDRATAALVGNDAVAWESQHPRSGRHWVIAMGDEPGEVARCLVGLVEQVGAPYGLTVERRAFPKLPPRLRPVEHWEWDWWYSTQPPGPRAGEAHVTALAVDDGRIDGLLDAASPDAMTRPGDRHVTGWWGIEADHLPDPPSAGPAGLLVAVAAVTEMRPGVPHLSSVATRSGWRGRGLARDLCGRLTRDALAAGAPAVTLGMHAGNTTARRVYDSLGFRVGYRWASGTLPAGPS
jgi:GNAT superfamily N-acetyltransferase